VLSFALDLAEFLDMTPKGNKKKNRQLSVYENFKTLCFKRHCQHSKNATLQDERKYCIFLCLLQVALTK
jgi:hypothetical protein